MFRMMRFALPRKSVTHSSTAMFATASSSMPDAILFGSIGSLVHLCQPQYVAWNQALQEKGFPEWDKKRYVKSLAESLKFNGGRNRLASMATQTGMKMSPEDADAICARKHQIFQENMRKEGLKVRPGVKKLLKEARKKGIKTAFVTTTPRSNVEAMMESMDGLNKEDFDMVTYGESAFQGGAGRYGEGKPSADPYMYVVRTLDVERPIAFEDTYASLQSPVNAGIPCIALPNEWSTEHDFSQARAVMPELGEDVTVEVVAKAASPLRELKMSQ